MHNDKGQKYTYGDAGFDGFFRRTLGRSDPSVITLRQSVQPNSRKELNFDDLQATGALGDVVRFGNTIVADSTNGRVKIINPVGGDEVVRLGDVSDL